MDTLLLPQNEPPGTPELSIVIPALDEEITIAEFVAWCQEGLRGAGIHGEILIIDSSTDRTAERAVAGGARVLRTPKLGLGRSLSGRIAARAGRFILMGDADCTYDFREIKPFVESFRRGNEFIMGSRFRGFIEADSMPRLHRYFGTPVTTRILNLIYGSKFTDIHCGMRGIAREAFTRMRLGSVSWEYASEMVLKSVQMQLKTDEVPVRFLKDKEGRLSHHKRAGWLSPWKAGWANLRAMLVNGAEFFGAASGDRALLAGPGPDDPSHLRPDPPGPDHLFRVLDVAGDVPHHRRLAKLLHGLPLAHPPRFHRGCPAAAGTPSSLMIVRSSSVGLLSMIGVLFLLPLCSVYLRARHEAPGQDRASASHGDHRPASASS